MLTGGQEADAYLTTQAMKSHLDQLGGCVVSSVVKRAGWGWTPPLSLTLLDAGRCPLQTGVEGGGRGCSWSSSGGQPLVPCANRKVELNLPWLPVLRPFHVWDGAGGTVPGSLPWS